MPKKHLAIEINTGAVRFVKLDGSFVLSKREHVFTDKQDYRYNQQLSDFMAENQLKEIDFDECSVCWSGKQSTIVPTNVFNESSANSIFKLCFGEGFESNEIDYNRVSDPNVVNVHHIPFWVKSFFVIKFPRVVMQHEGTHLLRGIFKNATFKLKATLVFHEDFFQLVVVKENNLQFYSSFDYTSIEDIVYYISFTIQQKEWMNTPMDIVLSNGVGAHVDIQELTNKLLRILGKEAKIISEEYLLANYQELCV